MRKLIDLDDKTLIKLKMLSVFEHTSVKALIENAVLTYVQNKEKDRFDKLTDEEKEDLGMLMLLQEVDRSDKVSEDEIFKILGK